MPYMLSAPSHDEWMALRAAERARAASDARVPRLREAVAVLVRHIRRLGDHVRRHGDFYREDAKGAPPPPGPTLEHLLNPKKNQACRYLNALERILMEFAPGEVPANAIERLFWVHDGLVTALRKLGHADRLNVSDTVMADLRNLLLEPERTFSRDEYKAELVKLLHAYKKSCERNSDGFALLAESARTRHRASRRPAAARHSTEPRYTDAAIRAMIDFVCIPDYEMERRGVGGRPNYDYRRAAPHLVQAFARRRGFPRTAEDFIRDWTTIRRRGRRLGLNI